MRHTLVMADKAYKPDEKRAEVTSAKGALNHVHADLGISLSTEPTHYVRPNSAETLAHELRVSSTIAGGVVERSSTRNRTS